MDMEDWSGFEYNNLSGHLIPPIHKYRKTLQGELSPPKDTELSSLGLLVDSHHMSEWSTPESPFLYLR